jgi:hypothetical protein
MKKTVE